MATRQRITRHGSRGRERAATLVSRLGTELRIARLTAGLTQAQVAAMVGVSQPFVSLVERGRRRADLRTTCALASAAGHELSVRLFPMSTPSLRDSGQLQLVESITGRAHPSWQIRMEEPVGMGDRRSADLLLIGSDQVLHVEVERWLVDLQAQLRAAQLKRQALSEHLGRAVKLIIAVQRTERARNLVAALPSISQALPGSSAEAWRAIEHGAPLTADALLFVRPSRRRS